MAPDRYIPALRFHWLTSLYDPAIRWTTREATFKRRLLDQAAPQPGQRVLDLGCGTGTLAIMAKRAQPDAHISGLDADPDVLERARDKADAASLSIRFDQGLSNELPYVDASFDLVLSSLFFHHLSPEDKRQTSEEIARVLKPGGALHVADWGCPADPLMRALSLQIRFFDGFEATRDNLSGALPIILERAGLIDAAERAGLRTMFGTLAFFCAKRPEQFGQPTDRPEQAA